MRFGLAVLLSSSTVPVARADSTPADNDDLQPPPKLLCQIL